ncbi:phospholipid carrier-dependent glycosyltransferase [Nonomuraea sp. NPDC048916]|uniref:phospholipid carrier-dependent glycosyltransferase n=1 Tax=Nonomuraea sp. NPDC048916 TaxID=3154232 RepID=UPI00340C4E8A
MARVLLFLRRHRVFAAAFALGAVLRLVTMLGYGPAMWFNDSYEYVSVALHPRPHPIRPDGYGFWLLALKPFHSFTLVVFTQHLMGLATAVLIYALLRRKFGLPKWGATLAAAPVLFDAYQIQLEQLVMSDSMFTLLVVAAITLVLWHRRMSWKVGVVVGLLLALTWLTRSIGAPILALVVVYLLVKRVGWKPIVAVVVTCALPILTYMGWFASSMGKFAMTNSDGLILYMRTAIFADCNRMNIDKYQEIELLLLCINDPVDQRKEYAQWYLWGQGGGGTGTGEVLHRWGAGKKFTEITNEAASAFATRAILSQPGDYLRVVARDFFRAFHWDRPRFPDEQTYNMYEFRPYYDLDANGRPKRLPQWPSFQGRTDTDAYSYEQGPPETRIVSPWADIMSGYQQVFYLRGIVLGGIMLVGLYGVAVRWRTFGGPVVLPWLGAFGLLLAPAATAEFDYRYVLPAVPLACVAAAITLSRVSWGRGRPPDESASEPTTVPA